MKITLNDISECSLRDLLRRLETEAQAGDDDKKTSFQPFNASKSFVLFAQSPMESPAEAR